MDYILQGTDLLLYGTVGPSSFFMDEEGFTDTQVINALAAMRGKPVNVRINSGGGLADMGRSIYNSLKAHDAQVTVYVDGIAASAASAIAMAGNPVIMRTGSVMMVHDPMAMTAGNAADHLKSAEMLNVAADSMASIYAAKTGKTPAEARADMKAEIWLTPEAAVEQGYADTTDAAPAVEAAAFDYRAYAHAPQQILALSDGKKWSGRLKSVRATLKEPPPMTDTISKEAAAAQAKEAADAARKEESTRIEALSKLCTEAKEPSALAGLIRDGVMLDAARAKLAGITAIRDLVAVACKTYPKLDANLADFHIAAGSAPEKVSQDILERVMKLSAMNIDPHHGSGSADIGELKPIPTNPVDIYANRAKARASHPIE